MTEREMKFLTFYRGLDPDDQELIRLLFELVNTLKRLYLEDRSNEVLASWSEITSLAKKQPERQSGLSNSMKNTKESTDL